MGIVEIVVAILTALGGGAAIVLVLFRWLGDIVSKRILQREATSLAAGLQDVKLELSLRRLNYEKHVEHVVDYYARFYRMYQICQQTQHADLIRHEGRGDLDTKKDFLEKIDEIAEEWNAKQGLVRLLLPKEALELHANAIKQLNKFKDIVKAFKHDDKQRKKLGECFHDLHKIKQELEGVLRRYLRVDT